MSFLSPDQAGTPAQPKVESAAALPPILGPQGSKPKSKNQRSTFLGGESLPGGVGSGTASGNLGAKTLLGM